MSEVPKIRCPKCGARVPASYLVCPYCGAELARTPVVVAEARSLRERLKALFVSLKTLNAREFAREFFVPVPGLYTPAVMLLALNLASPFIGLGPYRYLGFAASFLLRYTLFLLVIGTYHRIVALARIEDRDVRTESLGLASVRLLLAAVALILSGNRNVRLHIGLATGIVSAATLYVYAKYGRLKQYGIVPILGFAVIAAFLALRIFSPASESSWTSRGSSASTRF